MHTFLVVIYKRCISDVVTLNTLSRMAPATSGLPALFIWDNSPPQFEQENSGQLDALREKFSSVEYHRATENCGLSVLYNQVLDKALHRAGTSITILDHDSEIPPDFLLKIEGFLSGAQLIVPKVVSNRSGSMISPRYQASHYLSIRPSAPITASHTAAGEQASKDLFAVGSGMTITAQLWSTGIRFDKDLSFYGVDTEFCRDYSAGHRSFIIADTHVLHDISSEGREDLAIQKWRFDSHMDYWGYQLRKHSRLPHFAIAVYVAAWRSLIKVHFLLKQLRSEGAGRQR